jgi:2-dehydro-3-deoxygluconokinase
VFYVTAIGTEPLSLGMIQRWQEERINTDLVLQDASRQQGLYVIQLDQYGERTFLYWGNQSAARYLHQHPE